MHYYPFNLKDYLVQTAHLPPMADLAYRRLLDLYYLEEMPIPNKPKWVANRIRLDSEEQIIGFVLREYFELRGTGTAGFWHHERCDKVIAKYQKKAATARANGVLHVAGTKKEPKSDADRSITKNHKPRRNTPLPPEGGKAFELFWNEHPRKVGKPKAMQAYAAALERGAKPEDILAGLKRHLPVWNAKKAANEGDLIPHPSTWLNRDGWNDEVMPQGQRGGSDGDRTDWWESKSGLLDRGMQLGIPAPADEGANTWAQFKASVWVAAGDGPWWDKSSVAYPIAVRLRDQGNEVAAAVLAGIGKGAHHGT